MPTPAIHIQTRVNRQYMTTIQQCFSILNPVVFMQPDPADMPRVTMLTRDRVHQLVALLNSAIITVRSAASWYPELVGMENHANRIELRLIALSRIALHTVDTQQLGYDLATVAYGCIESLPADLFRTDADNVEADPTAS